MTFPILTSLVALPIAGAIVLLAIRDDEGNGPLIQKTALVISVLVFAQTLLLWARFNPDLADFQFVERHAWIPSFGISYAVGVDGISLFLLVLTGFLTPLALLSSWESVHKKVRAFSITLLLLESAMMGVFVSLDLFLFYVFWDAMLIPMYFLIGIWGYERRIYAAVKFILYTMAGSVLMLLAILGLALLHFTATGRYSFDLLSLSDLVVPAHLQFWFFLAFALAFAIKVPLFPFHTWLPDAHVEAPTAGSVILAGVLLKMGTYGLVRFAFPLFPTAATFFAPYLAGLAVISIVYGALVAMVQPDMKKLVAYSSISHLGFVVLGIASMNLQGVQGAVYQMVNHGVSTGGLFLIVGMLSDRRHTRLIAEFGGLKKVMPRLVAVFLIVTLSSIGLPGLNGFVGEFLILLGAFSWDPRLTAVAATGVILSATYMLWMFQRVNYGVVTAEKNAGLPDLGTREWVVILPIVALAVLMGVLPNLFLRPMEGSVERLVNRVRSAAPVEIPGELMLSSFNAVVPMACLTAAAIAAMTAEAFREPGERFPIGPLGVIGLAGAAVASVLLWNRSATSFGVVVADNFGLFVNGVLIVIGLLSLALSPSTLDRERLPRGEYYALMLFAIAGMMLMATATDLLVIFLALEVLSLAVYVLTGLRRDSAAATEAAFKYFLLGAFSSAFFLYGIAFTYGLTGSTRLERIGSLMAAQALAPAPMQMLAVGLLLVGFAFKVSAVPFHMWTPDAYEAAPTTVTGFMSTGVKAAAFAAFVRVFLSAFEPLRGDWSPLVWTVAAATMILGTVVGVAQTSVKRMLAYSSIAHGGYLLVALVSANDFGKGAILFYLLAYAVANVGAFGVIAVLENGDRQTDRVQAYAGLWSKRPALALLMTVFLLSLGGFPPLGGFIAKWYVFSAAIAAGNTWLAIIGVLTSVVSVFFYLRIVVMMYMTPGDRPGGVPAIPGLAGAALIASALVVLYLGILPARILDLAAASISTIF